MLGERTGYVFCDRVFMCFVPQDLEGELERDTLTCLGLTWGTCSRRCDRCSGPLRNTFAITPREGHTLQDRDRLADALEAPWGLRIEKRLREAYTPETARGAESTRKIADVVRELGLQPWKASEPLDPIAEDEIHVVVWMGVVAEGE